ncbi:relE/StbE family addiction module toxin [Mycoplasma sp. CAG:611]|nr:relE/StbE family addiction module toxin [Mycoplasma sp. CAG:611]
MTSYKYDVVYSTKFKKALKKLIKQGKDINELFDIIDKLANDEKLNMKYKNHSLVNDKYYKDCNECHINPDWLLIYRYNKDKLLLLLIDTGSHSELFK